MAGVPDYFSLYTIGAAFLVALILSVAGVLWVVRLARKLAARIEDYSELPFLKTAELTAARLQIAADAVARIPMLRARAQRAISDIQTARANLTLAATTTRDAVLFMVTGH